MDMAQSRPNIDVNKKGVTVDENGVPYYKWPPFPDPPEGVNIIPFNEFKPSGIQISFNDDVEVDGLGIPTVRLAVTHDNEAPPKKKSKTKKTPTGEEVRRRNVWWEEWAEGEEQRIRSVRAYDQMLHPKARVAHAIEDFQRLHDWEPVSSRLKEWFGKLLYFLGQNDVTIRPRFKRMREEDIQPDDEDDADDAASDEQKHAEPTPVKIDKFDEQKQKQKLRESTISAEQEERLRQKVARVREMQELRLEAFIDNPELATKIFLSSYFRDCGMMWEKMALRDAPRILEFFLNFLLETRALYEEETSLKKALEIARRGKEELPLTMKIGVNMPDELAQCLKATYGSRVKQLLWPDELQSDTVGAEFKARVEESGGMIISDLVSGPEPADGNTAGGELPQADETTGGWSSIGVDTAGWGGGNWAGDNNEAGNDNPWAQASTTTSTHVWVQPETHNLMALLGPTTLPLTYTVGYVEESTRYVSSVTLPEEDVKLSWHDKGVTSGDRLRSFAQVVLKPYPRFAEPTAPRAAIQPPELLEDPWSKVSSDSAEKPRIPRHNPKKDSITMLIDPEVGKDLTLGKRMGLGGTFVQVVPRHDDTDSDSENASDEITFWYAEKILQIIPSFWTEKQI